MSRSPVSLFIRKIKSGPVWYARFYDEHNNRYAITKSTGVEVKGKKGRKQEAYNVALSMLPNISFEDSQQLIPYLKAFWQPNGRYSRYKKLVEGKPLSAYYLELNQKGIENHLEPYPPFQKVRIDDLTAPMIEDWKLWAIEQGTGKRRINTVLQAMEVPFRYALSREEIQKNPFDKVSKIRYAEAEKGILSPDENEALLTVIEKDTRVKSAVLLAAFCGLRRGEVRGLKWNDIDFEAGLLNIHNNWIDGEGLKDCKTGSNRQTILHSSLIPVLKELKENSPYRSVNGFVHFSHTTADEPFSNTIIKKGFYRVLKSIGIDEAERKERNISYHSLRHSFVTLARMAGLSDMAIMALAGHKSSRMMERYSHGGQAIDFIAARKKIEGAAI